MNFYSNPLASFVRSIGNAKNGGYVLLTALVFTAILFTVSVGLVSFADQYSISERYSIGDSQALQLAEGGIDNAVYQLNQNLNYNGETLNLPGGTVVISIASASGNDKRITSTAYVPNQAAPLSTRVVKATATVGNTSVAFHYGVQVGEGGYIMNGGSVVNGSIYSNGNIQATNGVTITGGAIAADPAATTTDQSNDQPSTISSCTASTCIDFGNSAATQDFAQSFQVSQSQPMNSVEFYIKKTGAPNDETVRIVNDNSGVPGTDSVMSGTLSSSLVTTSFGWVKVTMPTTPILAPGQTYWLVIDGASNANKYYTIGANSSYANGTAKIGAYSAAWNNTSPSGLDGYFHLYLGGGYSFIGGDTYSGGVSIGTTASDDAWAHQVQGATVSGTNYCQIGTVDNKACNTSKGDPPAVSMPISDGNITDWKNDAAAGTVVSGDVTVGASGATFGPEKINGNLTINGGGTLTMTGTIWVTGNLTVTSGGKVKLSASYAGNEGVIISDGYVTINGGANFAGSGSSGSYPFVVTTSSCPADPGCSGNYAINESGGAGTVALVAQSGTANLSGGSALRAVTARQVIMTGGATLTYDSGLINSNFYSGPGGSYSLLKGSYVIAQ